MVNSINLTDGQLEILHGKLCPYCKHKTQYVDSKIIYGKSYGMIYYCKPCSAWVGVHKDTDKSKGRLANSELRELKKEAHFYFDKIWKEYKILNRKESYKWLSSMLSLPCEYTHIGFFAEKYCEKTILVCKKLLKYNNKL